MPTRTPSPCPQPGRRAGPVAALLPALLLAFGAAGCALLPPGKASPPSPFDDRMENGWAYARNDRYLEAAGIFEDAETLARDRDDLARALVARAEALESARRPEEALSVWQEAAARLEGHPAAVRARYHAATLLYESLGRKEEALSILDGIVRNHPDAVQAVRALQFLTWARPPGAPRVEWLRALYPVVEDTALAVPVLETCAEAAEEAELWPAALDCWGRIVRAHPDSGRVDDALLAAAVIERRLGRLEAARDLYQEVVLAPASEGPAFPSPLADEALWALAEVERALGDVGAAEAALARLVERHPASPLADDALAALARSRAEAGDEAAARRAWRRLLEGYPGSRHVPDAEAALR